MRIISGKYKHRLISYPINNPDIRPTKDRIREAIFSALGDISNATCLDLYAGSGAMGLEAISRGAKKVYFNDYSKEAINVIKQNIGDLALNSSYFAVSFKEDELFLEELKQNNTKMDLIFLDPPYKKDCYVKIIDYLFKNNLLNSSAIFVCESNHRIELDNSKFSKVKEYKYGDIFVTICWR